MKYLFFYTFGQSQASVLLMLADTCCGETLSCFQHGRPHCLLKLFLKLDGVS